MNLLLKITSIQYRHQPMTNDQIVPKLLLLLFLCSFRLSSHAQTGNATNNENTITLPTGSYYFDSYEHDKYTELIIISHSSITREKTNVSNETYKNTHKVTHSYEVAKNLYLLFTENREEGYEMTLDMMVLQIRDDGISVNDTFYWPSTSQGFFDLVNQLSASKADLRTELLYQKKFIKLYQYYPNEKYKAIKSLPTATVNEISELVTKFINQYFSESDDFYLKIYDKYESRQQVTQFELDVFNFMLENSFQPYTSTKAFFTYARSTDNYRNIENDMKRAKRTKSMVFFENLGDVFKILGAFSLAWFLMAIVLRNKYKSNLKSIEQNPDNVRKQNFLLPRYLKPIFNILAILGFSVNGGYFGFGIGWGIAQVLTSNSDGGLIDIMMAVVLLVAGATGGLVFGIWVITKFNKVIYKTS